MAMFLKALQKNKEYFTEEDKACLTKLREKESLYFQLLTHFTNRVLTLMRYLVQHDVQIEGKLMERFGELVEQSEGLTEAFAMTK